MNPPLEQITVQALAEKMAIDPELSNLQLVDVRETQELEIASIPGFVHLPLSGYEQWQGDIHTRLDTDKETLVLCHHGMRSAQMCQWLMAQGFTQVKNIIGGIDAYSTYVDRTVPKY